MLCKLFRIKRSSLAALSVGKFQRLAKTTRAKGTNKVKGESKVKVKVKRVNNMGRIGKCISYLKSENICFALLPLHTHTHTRTHTNALIMLMTMQIKGKIQSDYSQTSIRRKKQNKKKVIPLISVANFKVKSTETFRLSVSYC